MARKWSNLNLPGALHYVTGNVVNRIPIFKQECCCIGFLNILKALLQEWPGYYKKDPEKKESKKKDAKKNPKRNDSKGE